MDLVYDRTDKNGTKIYLDYNCPKCGGSGVLRFRKRTEIRAYA